MDQNEFDAPLTLSDYNFSRHSFNDDDFPLDGSITLAENFCRNPRNKRQGGVWCLTQDPNTEWEFCHVALCGGKSNNQYHSQHQIG